MNELKVLFLALFFICTADTRAMPTENSHYISPKHTEINITGRYAEEPSETLLIGYPGVSLSFAVNAKELTLIAMSSQGQSYLDIEINKENTKTIKIPEKKTDITLFSTEEKKLREVTLTHRTETWQGIVKIFGFRITDGQLFQKSVNKKRKMLVIGDSVTCGESTERPKNAKPEDKNASWWNGNQSYGMQLGRLLNAETHLVCYGGRGLTRSWDGDTTSLNAPDFFELAIAEPQKKYKWQHNLFEPDAILISLGTNDFSESAGELPAKSTFVNKYIEFLKRIRAVHNGATIIITDGAILNNHRNAKAILQEYLKTTIAEISDNNIHYIESNHYPGDNADAHPTKSQHMSMADDFSKPIKKLMNW